MVSGESRTRLATQGHNSLLAVRAAESQNLLPAMSKRQGYATDISGVLLRGEASPRTQWLFTGGGADAFRSGRYKIHLATKTRSSNPDTRKREPAIKHDPPLLFDLNAEISEQTDLSASKPEAVMRLLAEMKACRGR